MNIRTHLLYFGLLLLPFTIHAQSINNTLAYKNINSDRYARINYENDFFGFTDEYYTQGMHAEVVAPWVWQFPLSHALLRPRNSHTRYGVGIEHNGFTPSSISSDAILYNDRPFAATLFLKTFAISVDSTRRQRFSATLSTGAIGPVAGGKELQTNIHKALNNITPHGWDNQIKNDVIVNYEVDFEQELLAYRNILSVSANGNARIGSLSDKASAGLTLMLGYFDSPFSNYIVKGNNLRIYGYEHAQANLVGYDATMQGGVFNVSSPYTIDASDISRGVLENRFGFVITYQRLYLEYFQSIYGKEFAQGKVHNFGGVQIAVGF